MVGAILIMLLLPVLDSSRIRGFRFRPIGSMVYWLFLANFGILLWIGGQPVEVPYDEIGKYSTILYFLYFAILPMLGYGEDILVHVGRGASPGAIQSQGDCIVTPGGGNTFNR